MDDLLLSPDAIWYFGPFFSRFESQTEEKPKKPDCFYPVAILNSLAHWAKAWNYGHDKADILFGVYLTIRWLNENYLIVWDNEDQHLEQAWIANNWLQKNLPRYFFGLLPQRFFRSYVYDIMKIGLEATYPILSVLYRTR